MANDDQPEDGFVTRPYDPADFNRPLAENKERPYLAFMLVAFILAFPFEIFVPALDRALGYPDQSEFEEELA